MLRKLGCLAVVAVLGAAAGPVSGGDTPLLEPSPLALPAVTTPGPLPDPSTCAGSCQSRHDRCRVSTKDGPSCDSDRQRCLQTCIAKKGH